MIPRRRFILNSLAIAASPSLLQATAPTSKSLPPWTPGVLEIHQIATNRGNSALLILPDGTTMMVDAGAIYGTTPYLTGPLPSAQRRPGEWIGRYTKRRLEASGLNAIDTFLLTHLHGDHLGYLPPEGPLSEDGTYRLTGVSDVAAIVPIKRFVDRAWPDYTYPAPANADFQKNYRAFLQSQSKAGKKVERFHPGSKDQFTLQHKPATYPTFEIRNLIANGELWTGEADQTRKLFPDLSTLKPADYPAENPCSCAIRLRYGKFAYYTGGDLTNDTNYGRDPWRDSESPAAEVCGPVSVAVTNHHGYFNANGDRFVRALQPQVFIIPTWDSAHPTVNVLNTLFSKAIYPANRDVFATSVKQENRIANKKTDDLKSRAGHIVIRVEPGGNTFAVHILSNADETDTLTATFGPSTFTEPKNLSSFAQRRTCSCLCFSGCHPRGESASVFAYACHPSRSGGPALVFAFLVVIPEGNLRLAPPQTPTENHQYLAIRPRQIRIILNPTFLNRQPISHSLPG